MSVTLRVVVPCVLAVVSVGAVSMESGSQTLERGKGTNARPEKPTLAAAPPEHLGSLLRSTGPQAREPDRLSSGDSDGAIIALGDQLKVRFFERIEILDDKTRAGPLGLVERGTLSDTYIVQPNGRIVLPILGSIEAEGRTTEALTRTLAGAYQTGMRQTVDVSVTIAERYPIYVVGPSSKTGIFKYVPGMTVLHALALLGSGAGANPDIYLQSELVRQRERQASAQRKLAKAWARQSALQAALANGTATVPERLAQIVEMRAAEKLLLTEVNLQNLMMRVRMTQIDAQRARLGTARQEVEQTKARHAVVQQHAGVKAERRRTVNDLKERRSASPFLSLQAESDFHEMTERQQAIGLMLTQARQRLAEAELGLTKLEQEQRLQLEREIAEVASEIVSEEAALASSREFIDELSLQSARDTLGKRENAWEIVRQTKNGPLQLEASQLTQIQAGDLVRPSQMKM